MLRTDMLKKHNLFEILRAIRNAGTTTKPQISKATGLAPATVHNLVNELTKNDLVTQLSTSVSSGGRRAPQYVINDSKFYIVGMNMGTDAITVGVYDLSFGQVSHTSLRYLLSEHSVEECVALIQSLVRDMLYDAGLERQRILGVGISVPGLVNFDKGIILQLFGAPNWNNIPLRQMLETGLKIPVIIDSDSNNSALYLEMQSVSSKFLACMTTTYGISVGLASGGQIYRGANNFAGELGHLTVDVNGPRCACGNAGCLQLYASDYAVLDQVRSDLAAGRSTLLRELCGGVLTDITMDLLSVAARSKDPYALEVLRRTAKYIGIGVSNAIKVYDPDHVVISSTWLGKFPDILVQMQNDIYTDYGTINRDNVAISLNYEKDIFAKGAAALVLEDNLNEYISSRLLGE